MKNLLYEMSADKIQELCNYVFDMGMTVMQITTQPNYPNYLKVTVRTPDLETGGDSYFEDEIGFTIPNVDSCGLSPSNFTLNDTDIDRYYKFLYANGYMPLDYVDFNELLVWTYPCPLCGETATLNAVINQDIFVGTCCSHVMVMTSDRQVTSYYR